MSRLNSVTRQNDFIRSNPLHAGNVGVRNLSPESLIVSLITYLRSGASLSDALNFVRGRKSVSLTVDAFVISRLVAQCNVLGAGEKKRLKLQLLAVCMLSQLAGCSAARCLEILHEDMKRYEQMGDKRKDATAIARLTVRVLLGLPVLTTVLSELTGVHVISFLFTSVAGAVSFTVSASLYMAGLIWSRRLIAQFYKDTRYIKLN